MPLETNFNAAPYFDDYSANANFYRVLFKPAVAVQARELTQMQTILQDQIEKFGSHIFKDGSIVEGCTVNFDPQYQYVKLQDTTANGSAFTVTDFIGNRVVSSANLQAVVINGAAGFEANDPDLNTIYVRYLNSANYANGAQQKTFDPGEALVVQTSDNSVITDVRVATSGLNPIGNGYAVSISEGTVFKNGFFVRVDPQTLIVSKYDTAPNDLSVGFVMREQIVTADADASLYDNALGSTNLNAPGANRLKLVANLAVRVTENTATSNTSDFFSIINFKDGNPVALYTNPQYAKLGVEMARRTYEESGNYIVDPFELTVTSNTTNSNNLVLEVDKGLGYVYGYRVEFADKNRVTMRKGTDTVYFPNQIITANYGNYVFVNELAGPFDLKMLDEVQLYATPARATVTSGNYDPASAVAPAGTLIGTAKVRDVRYHSGVPGTPEAVYQMYLFDIVITAAGFSFEDTRTFYATTPDSVPAYADAVLEGGIAVLKETGSPDLVFSLGRAAVNTVNTSAMSFIYRATANVEFAANGLATISIGASYTGGTDTIVPRGSLSEDNEARFIVVPNTSTLSTNITTVSVTSGCSAVTSASAFTSNFRVGDYITVFDTAATANNRVVSITNSTHLVVNSTIGFTNAAADIARLFPAGIPISFQRDDQASINVASDGTGATINVGITLVSTMRTFVVYDTLRSSARHAAKAINKNRFVKIQANTHPNTTKGPWSLGLPDVHKIRNVYQGTSGTTSDTNSTSLFSLDSGQRSSVYNLASLYIKPGTSHTVGPNDILTVELDHFTRDVSQGIGYFSFMSYPLDDANTANAAAIQTADIPLYTSDTGSVYDLRDSLDFRQYYSNTANSSTTTAGATVNPPANSSIIITSNAYGAFTPVPDEDIQTAFAYFLGRKDKVSLSPEGKINITEGTPSASPSAPRDLDGAMTLGTVTIPPYPSLSQAEVRTFGRPEYGVSIDLQQYRRYTMKDIGVIDKKLARLEYYTSLSLLESSAKTLTIKDSVGLERFKNGFIVDPFKGFSVSDTKNPEYKAAIDIKMQEMAPTITRTYVDLDYNANLSSGVTKTGSLIQLESNTTPYIDQLFASKTRNCVENIIYTWNGNIELTPEGDVQPDIDVNPDVVGSVDLSGITDLVNALPSIISPERIISTSTVQDTVTRSIVRGTLATGLTTITGRDVFATTTTTTARNELDFSASTLNNTFDFGEVVQDVSIQQFVRPRLVRFKASSLKPNTIVYPFFDSQPVSQHVTPTDSSYVPTDSRGGTLQSDSEGNVYGTFTIPAQTFKVGERVFRLVDVDSIITQEDSITTQAAATYIASNIAITKSRYRLATRTPQIAINSSTISNTTISSRLVSTTTSSVFIPPPAPAARGPGVDPIAQSFLIADGGENSGVYVDSIDLYFRTRHSDLGVEVQIREMENGFPTLRIVPFGRKVLAANAVSTSSDSSVATRFTFDAPVFLRSGDEYCFVVMPVGSNDGYNIWCGELGGTDIITGTPIFVNNSTGVLFTSSTNRVWTPFQKEDIKFVINRRRYIATSGTIVYTNSDTEYMTANNFLGSFLPGETVYVSNGVVGVSANVIGNTTSNTINAVSTGTNTQVLFTANSLIYISSNNGTVTNIRQIVSIPNANQVTLDAPLSFDESNGSIGVLRANGELSGVLLRWNSSLMHLEQSTANATSNFTNAVTASANALLIGAVSGARANLVSVDSVDYSVVIPQFSYIAPSGSTVQIKMKGYSSSLDSNFTSTSSDIETFFSDKERNVKSRSIELRDGTGKTLQVSVDVSSDTDRVSPVFDDIKSDILVIENNVSNNASLSDEDLPNGGTTAAKYVSKRVVLAEGQDANDLQVYLSAYKPANTNITVYAKFVNGDDNELIDEKYWTPLQQVTSEGTISSRIDRNDFKEFQYNVPTGFVPNSNPAGYFSVAINSNTGVSNTNDTITVTDANTYFTPGDLVLYRGDDIGISNNEYYHVVSSNSTTIKVSTSLGGSAADLTSNTTGTGTGTVYLIPFTAFKESGGSNAVSYFTSEGGLFHGFKIFSIKIVMTSEEGSHLVPRVADMRAIALQ